MGFPGLYKLLLELEKNGHLHRISQQVDPHLEMAEMQRRAYQAGAPALLFENLKGSAFPAVSNLYGTEERCAFLFRGTYDQVKRAVALKADPPGFLKQAIPGLFRQPMSWLKMPFTALNSLPKRISPGKAPVLANETQIDKLPAVVSWPDDGGPFITLPQVYSEDPNQPGVMHSNLGMYRVQLSGNQYAQNEEVGLHYQIHRGLGIHHSAANERGEPLKVSIFVGGHPAHAFAAVMPLPEGLPELLFAGMLAGQRFRYTTVDGYVISADADFCITGTIEGQTTKAEGPFGDHLGYYSLAHPFPVLRVHRVFHRNNAIWPFTVVGRPPQEDTSFGAMIHRLTEPMVPVSLPGVKALHAVDAAGVHPLLLAVGSERYVPFSDRRPQELLTQANAILGFNQCSLAKYLFIAAGNDKPAPDINNIEAFLSHMLERVDWRRDLHFQTATTIDTLDYSGTGLNQGSKLVIAVAGPVQRQLAKALKEPAGLPDGYSEARLVCAGILAVKGPAFSDYSVEDMSHFCRDMDGRVPNGIALIVVVNDSEFTARDLNNFLWTTFTRSNPSHDVHGVGTSTQFKHWGCSGPLVIDARLKPHHAPPLIEDPEITRKVHERRLLPVEM